MDWSPIEQPNDGVVTHQNFCFMHSLQLASKLALLANDNEYSKVFLDKANHLEKVINIHLWDKEEQAFYNCIYSSGKKSKTYSVQTQVVAYLTSTKSAHQMDLENIIKKPPVSYVKTGNPFMSFFV